ncbi:SDR family oxidoreductase [Aminobacterium mobile]|uniref:SDR family oxidoreductase n=1 Tax=Aminobacterium mobile TaxID=81467 RepID=UPI0004655809|nr:SDR family oxidoreductase [Aminobacterium mobile]
MSVYKNCLDLIQKKRRTWLITGVAGFIGSHVAQTLLLCNQRVVGLDNFSTGKQENIEEIKSAITPQQRENFTFSSGDIRDRELCFHLCKEADVILHQAALASVPASIEQPLTTHDVNVTGFLNILEGARQNKTRVVYASSSAIYGDEPGLPKIETMAPAPLSPYGLTKLQNEEYATLYTTLYNVPTVGLRYFNVFGPRQDPHGAYAAVIPAWITARLTQQPARIYGDGENTRDFCYIDNVVQANLLAATTENKNAFGLSFNVAGGHRLSLNELYAIINEIVSKKAHIHATAEPNYFSLRPGDIRHSYASLTLSERELGYTPIVTVREGLERTTQWFARLRD